MYIPLLVLAVLAVLAVHLWNQRNLAQKRCVAFVDRWTSAFAAIAELASNEALDWYAQLCAAGIRPKLDKTREVVALGVKGELKAFIEGALHDSESSELVERHVVPLLGDTVSLNHALAGVSGGDEYISEQDYDSERAKLEQCVRGLRDELATLRNERREEAEKLQAELDRAQSEIEQCHRALFTWALSVARCKICGECATCARWRWIDGIVLPPVPPAPERENA